MKGKQKAAAAGIALLIGASGYGVYATTLNITNKGNGFAAGSADVVQVEGFGAVVIDAGKPTFDPAKNIYRFKTLKITPTPYSDWVNIEGKTVTVTAYNADGKPIGSGQMVAPGWLDPKPESIPLSTFDANEVTNWAVLIQ